MFVNGITGLQLRTDAVTTWINVRIRINNPDAACEQCSMFRTDGQAIGKKVNSLSKCKFRKSRNLTG